MTDEYEQHSGSLCHQEPHHEINDEPHFASRSPSRVEVISGGNQRRRWSPQEKARITRESFGPAARVADVARRYGLSQGVLHQWRETAREAVGGASSFVPVQVDDRKVAPAAAKVSIEIDIDGATIRVHGRVDAEWLRAVVMAVRLRG